MKQKTSAFTLVELLVVIAIIAILMALLFPIMGKIKDTANKATARNDMLGIKGAVSGFYSDYGMCPMTTTQAGAASGDYATDTMFGDPGGLYPNEVLFNILRAQETTSPIVNNRKIVYIEGKQAKGQNTDNPTGGFVDQKGSAKYGKFLDPWGGEYVVWVDANNSGYADLFNFYNEQAIYMDLANPSYPSEGSGYFINGNSASSSLGKDGKWGKAGNHLYTNSDDVVSW